ncbi:MAG: hypothetical protein AAF570_27495, partial [Bacteroidota bacterium]
APEDNFKIGLLKFHPVNLLIRSVHVGVEIPLNDRWSIVANGAHMPRGFYPNWQGTAEASTGCRVFQDQNGFKVGVGLRRYFKQTRHLNGPYLDLRFRYLNETYDRFQAHFDGNCNDDFQYKTIAPENHHFTLRPTLGIQVIALKHLALDMFCGFSAGISHRNSNQEEPGITPPPPTSSVFYSDAYIEWSQPQRTGIYRSFDLHFGFSIGFGM